MNNIKNLLLLIIVTSLIIPSSVLASVRVRGSFRKSGSYVTSHYRSNPDRSKLNNWSTKSNINPYTEKAGKKRVD